MTPHLLRVSLPVVKFEEVLAALRQAGQRAGWLELGELADPVPSPLPEGLDAAARHGVLRAVAVAGGRSVTVKPMRGAPVLGDLLREHFRGCRLVLVRGAVDAPHLEPADDGGWQVTADDRDRGETRRYTTAELVTVLGRPRPWDSGSST